MYHDLDFEFLINRLPIQVVEGLKATPQNPVYHAEGNVYIHTNMVFNALQKYHNIDLSISAIFHDLGKIDTIRVYEKERGICIQTIGHENLAEVYIEKYKHLYDRFEDIPSINWDKVKLICSSHMRAHKYLSGEIKKESKRALFESHPYSKEIIQFAIADNEGRKIGMGGQSELIITLGIPGSGKSTWRKDFVSKHPEYKVICPDDIRYITTGSVSDMSQDNVVWQEAYHTLKEHLNNKSNVIFDSTACSVRTQKAIENIGRSFDAIILYKIFEVTAEEAKDRVHKDIEAGVNRSKVPDDVIDSFAEKFIVAKARVLEQEEAKSVFVIEPDRYKTK
jgi:predicted kinase